MSHDRGLPCGAWPSPLSPELCAAGAVSLGFAGSHRGTLLWTEGRPAEKGRSALMAWTGAGTPREFVGPDVDVRSRVHEYGGTPWCAAGDRLVWSEARDQRLRVREADGHPVPLATTLPTVAEGALLDESKLSELPEPFRTYWTSADPATFDRRRAVRAA